MKQITIEDKGTYNTSLPVGIRVYMNLMKPNLDIETILILYENIVLKLQTTLITLSIGAPYLLITRPKI